MADRGDTHYHVRSLNLWFAVASLAMLAMSVWMVIDDWRRPWKGYQREFRELELEQARATNESDKIQAQVRARADLQTELDAARVEFEARSAEVATLNEELRLAKGEAFAADQASKFAKAEYDWERYLIDEHRIETQDPTYEADKLAAVYLRMQEAAGKKEQLEGKVREVEARIAQVQQRVSNAERAIKSAGKDLDLVQQRLEKLDPKGSRKIAEELRDAPGLDFIGPNLKVNKVVLSDLTFNLNFTHKERIDMCSTCHLAMERTGYEEQPHPFQTHPRLDLFLSSKSPHPYQDFGCTVCHRGAGEALDFIRVDHRPGSAEERERWRDEHHWHKQHHWDYPMLTSEYTEASCVQCHKTSMELIAADAPKVSKGYELFEDYGCYACHKVDWFPTKRKPGPSLKNLQAKLSPEFVASWIADPKAFRPSTKMPQIFHLENFAPTETVSKSKYGEGRDILGQEWNDAAVASITSFLMQRHPKQALPPVPVEGDAVRGREAFRLSGCLACHNLADDDGTIPHVATGDLALERRATNEHGPNLRGVATKVTRDWLYWWIKDPASYWSETRMPNLRLSDEDAADIAAYIDEDPDAIFRDVPEGWAQRESPAELEVLQEQARWFFVKDGRETVERRLRGEDSAHRWDDKQALMAAVGEKFVLHQGCYSCHEIGGHENTMPIGVELSNWGSKTVDKLDFGFVPQIKAHLLGWDFHEVEEYKAYREGWLEQKLAAPRSFDLRKVKNPTEKYRMPWFDFSEQEIKSIATFVVGLVDDEVQKARMEPTAEQLAMDAGKRALRQNNCGACHVLEPGQVTFTDESGERRTVLAELMPLEDETLPPRMDRFKEYVADYVAYHKEDDEEFELEEITLRLLRAEPGLGDVGRTITVPLEGLEVEPPVGGDFVRLVTDYYLKPMVYDEASDSDVSRTPDPEGGVRDVDGEYRSYAEEAYDKVRWTFAPPVLLGEGDKVQRGWFYSFLKDPMQLRPQIRVRMPSFHWADGEAEAIADYFAHRAREDWPARLARAAHVQSGQDAAEFARAVGISEAQLASVEDGTAQDAHALAERIAAHCERSGMLDVPRAVSPAYEFSTRRSPSHIDAKLAANPDYLHAGEALGREGPMCFQCHFYRGVPPLNGEARPIAYAPDLERARERLREDWLREWIADPSRIYPGTAMPANFPPGSQQYQELYPGSYREQIDAILDWLYNLDRMKPKNEP